MDIVNDFKTKFYNLEGTHYNERKKNFYKMLNSASPDILPQLDVQPRNYLEKIFFVDILIRSKQVDRLVEILKEGNGVLTSRILKQKWFFEEAFKNMNENTIVNEFLPTLSYSMRMKVLKKLSLSLSEERMDKIFDFLLQRYGLFIAQQFLFSCSSTKFADVLKNNRVILSVEQLKRILDRDSNLIKIYLEEYKKNTGRDFADHNFLSYLTWKYPNLYFEFASNFDGCVKLGRKTTKSVLKINEEAALKDINKVEHRFNISTVTRNVKDFYEEYLPKLFPDDMDRIVDYCSYLTLFNFLKKYPMKKRWDVFSSAFKKAYNDDVMNHLELLDEQIAILFPNEMKHRWAEVKYKETENSMYVKYLDPEKAFLLIKEKLNVTSEISTRSSLLCDLIKLCHSNKDYRTYEEALKYICMRHRNDDKNLRDQLLREIANNIDLELSTENFWKYVNEVIDIYRAKGETLSFEILSQYLIFVFKRKLPADQAVAQYVKDTANQKYPTWSLHYFDKEREVKGDIIKHIMKFLHTIESDSTKKNLAIELLGEIVGFNERNRENLIDANECSVITGCIKESLAIKDVYDTDDITCLRYLIQNNYGKSSGRPIEVYEDGQLLDIIKSMCDKAKYDFMTLSTPLFEAVKKPRVTEFQNILLEYYFTAYFPKCYYYDQKESIAYFITKEPEVLVRYFDQIPPIEVKNSILDYSAIKLYSHLAFDEKLITHFKPLVSASSTCDSKVRLIENLSKIMSTLDFINLVTVYVPQKIHLDLTDTEQKRLYEAQCATAKAFKNLSDLEKLIPLLHSFCQGDYLQSSISVLYKVLYGVTEDLALSFINVLMDRAVSTRKHAVSLSFEVLSQKVALDLFNVIATREKNVSAKKYLFQGVLKYFLKNPSQQLLDMVITNRKFIDKNDKELLNTLTESVDIVSGKFKPVFVEHLWNFLDLIEKQEVKVVDYRTSVLSTINVYDVTFFSNMQESFCKDVIEKYFLSKDDAILKTGNMNAFVAKYLLAYKGDEQFEFVFDIVKKCKGLHWESIDKKKLRYIFEFFDYVYDSHIEKDVEFLKLFKVYWEQSFSHGESFNEYVLLNLMVLYKEHSDIAEFSKEVNRNFQDLISEYGPYINDLLVNSVKKFFSNNAFLTDKIFTNARFALELLKSDQNDFTCFIASSLIVDCGINDSKEVRLKVIETLKSVNSFTVRIRYNNLLKTISI